LELVDQRWSAIFIPSGALDGGQPDAGETGWIAIVVLAGGLATTGLIVGYLWFSLRHTQQLERLTHDLRETSDELRRNGAKLDHLARHDALTGLPNRFAFRDQLAVGLDEAVRGQEIAILYLDLDRFKAVNDTLGHPAGDQLLCQVADRLRASVRDIDTITRLGGDEFAIAQVVAEQPRAAQALARRVIEELSRPFIIDGQRVAIGASVGITLAGRTEMDVDDLLRRADLALYAAKRSGRGTWRFFEPSMELEARAWRSLEMDLRHALEHGEFELYYQPQVAIADGSIRGFEALLRWHHPDRGMVMPGDFIRCAEETGLVVPIGAWVLETALADAAHWPPGVRVAVNISPYQLARDDLAESVQAALTASGQNGERLELEVTEVALIQQHDSGHLALRRLREAGVRIAMDDFGTGYASLSHLRRFPFDRIKIDHSFIAGMTESPESAAIVRTILQLANTLGIATTAEGVETAEQLAMLGAGGCCEAMGFLLSPPRPAVEVSSILSGGPAMWPGFTRGGTEGVLDEDRQNSLV
jgi:diguanylate cyclase (GGDEF)-like protein